LIEARREEMDTAHQDEFSFVAGSRVGGESTQRDRLRALLSRSDHIPAGIRKQIIDTLVMARSPIEWIELEKTVNTESTHWAEVAEAKKKRRQATASFRRHGKWPQGYDPNVDPVEKAVRRDGHPDWTL
jgi:hypothetical protein